MRSPPCFLVCLIVFTSSPSVHPYYTAEFRLKQSHFVSLCLTFCDFFRKNPKFFQKVRLWQSICLAAPYLSFSFYHSPKRMDFESVGNGIFQRNLLSKPSPAGKVDCRQARRMRRSPVVQNEIQNRTACLGTKESLCKKRIHSPLNLPYKFRSPHPPHIRSAPSPRLFGKKIAKNSKMFILCYHWFILCIVFSCFYDIIRLKLFGMCFRTLTFKKQRRQKHDNAKG